MFEIASDYDGEYLMTADKRAVAPADFPGVRVVRADLASAAVGINRYLEDFFIRW